MKAMPSRDPNDPGYRRLHYCRYADDWLLGFTGPRQEAEQIKAEVGKFLHEHLKLELSPTKTLITHGRTRAARFLGYEITTLHADHKHDQRGHRSINAAIGLKVPADVVRAKCRPYLHHVSLARDVTPRPLYDNPSRIWNSHRSELVQRLLADACELCGSTEQVEVHHVRALKDLNPKGRKHPPEWVTRMASRRRKTLVVCRACHEDVHAGHLASGLPVLRLILACFLDIAAAVPAVLGHAGAVRRCRDRAGACHSLSPAAIGHTSPTLTPFAEHAWLAHGTNTAAVSSGGYTRKPATCTG